MSWRYKGGFIQEFFDPLTSGTLQPTLWSWGSNADGQLGQNDLTDRSSPVQIGDYVNWASISASISNSVFAIKSDKSMWAWGDNSLGMLGINDTQKRSSPTQVGALTSWSNVGDIREYSASAVRTDGTLWTWGRNNSGQLGVQDLVYRSSPVQVGSQTTWEKCCVTSFAMVAKKTDGTLWSWGRNTAGQLGSNVATTVVRSSPVQIGALTTWSKLSCGAAHVQAVKTDGTLWTWGSNAYGQLGINSQVDRSSPTQVGALTTWSSVQCGDGFTIGFKTDGTLWSWGQNGTGQLGISRAPASNSSSPIQIGTQTYWSANIGAGYGNVFAITSSGTMFEWGTAASGALGNNTRTSNLSSPVQLGALATWLSATSGTNFGVAIINT